MPEIVHGGFSARGLKFGIVVSRFNDFVTQKLHDAAVECLKKHGASEKDIESFSCPGSFEIPQVANHLAATGGYDALVCLGCVIRGETPHFKYIADEVTRGVGEVSRETGVPIAFGVLTTETPEQALERSGGRAGNKGWDAALSAIEMANLVRKIQNRRGTRKKSFARRRRG
jgi:6,7-dimethyl-8-ribityllumazine synthase